MAAEAAKNPASEGGPADAKADPSMEEILQSIRRIIAEDDPASAETARSEPLLEASGSDVLELTDMVPDDDSPAEPGMPEAASPPDVLASIDSALDEHKPTPASSPPPAPGMPMPKPAEASAAAPAGALLSDTEAAASASAFRKLAQSREKPERATPTASPEFRSGNTVEDLVLESLRPMLQSWLETNLRDIVERIVEREVKRLSGGL